MTSIATAPVALLAALLSAFSAGLASPALAASPPKAAEVRVAALMARLKSDPPALRVFLTEMPKGGDLHNHLDGSVWAEDYLKWADQDGDCLDATSHAISPPPCTSAQVAARGLMLRDPKTYQASIDALSVRNFAPGLGTGEMSGHDHAFAAFPRFGALIWPHLGDALAVTRTQAAADHVEYVEQIADPSGAFSPTLLGAVAAFKSDDFGADLAQVSPRLPALVAAARADYDAAETKMRADLGCGGAKPDPGCEVQTRYLFFVLRVLPPAQVFAQIALGYALAQADPRFVGVNLVAPEDDPVALRDFELQMRMFRFFSGKYPGVKLSLHAGELALGLVRPSELGFHIRDTVEIAGAERIGHGYEIVYERDAKGLLKEMAQRGVAVEINLTSNDISPGIHGADHPLALYRRAGVPWSLAADDEGVFRIDLTHEYVRAVLEQHLTYLDLKQSGRNGITYSFLPGASLWRAGGGRVAACAAAGPGCDAFLRGSEKAQAQWRLEQDFARFEAKVLAENGR
jgi:adenosine deaminase